VAWAIQANSVKSKHIVDGQVRTADVANDGSGHELTGTDINEGSLGEVPSATQADSAASAGDANTLDTLDSSAFARTGSEAWQGATLNDGSFGINPPGSYCHWLNFGSGHTTAAYFRDSAGVVHLKGLVKAADGSTGACGSTGRDDRIYTLSAGYLPAERQLFPVVANNKPGRVDVLSTGRVQIEQGFPTFADAKVFVSLDGISFRCAPSGQNGCP
jgi:hypothetical protein